MSEGDRTVARFGLLPDAAIKAAVAEGYNAEHLALAIFELAGRQGGMVS